MSLPAGRCDCCGPAGTALRSRALPDYVEIVVDQSVGAPMQVWHTRVPQVLDALPSPLRVRGRSTPLTGLWVTALFLQKYSNSEAWPVPGANLRGAPKGAFGRVELIGIEVEIFDKNSVSSLPLGEIEGGVSGGKEPIRIQIPTSHSSAAYAQRNMI
jgi:hypothetical protein